MDGRKPAMLAVRKKRAPVRKVANAPQARMPKRASGKSLFGSRKIVFIFTITFFIFFINLFLYMDGFKWIHAKTSKAVANIMLELDFQIKNIFMEGRIHTKATDVQKVIFVEKGTSMLEANPDLIRQRLESLPWVRSAIVQRQWPSTLHIRLIEQYPIAIWQKDAKHYLIDDQGHILEDQDFKNFRSLPVVTGEKAPAEAPALINILEQFPILKKNVTGATLVSGRRWDLIIHNKLTIKLPEEEIQEELEYLAKLLETDNLDSKNIISIDLRTPDRAYFFLGDDGLKRTRSTKLDKRK